MISSSLSCSHCLASLLHSDDDDADDDDDDDYVVNDDDDDDDVDDDDVDDKVNLQMLGISLIAAKGRA